MNDLHARQRLIESLEDQLDQFPLESVVRTHARLTDEALSSWSDYLASIGDPGRRYWTHPAELMYEEVGVLLGAMFVLLQAGITETVSIVMRLHRLQGQPLRKEAILDLAAPVQSETGLSLPKMANAAANYYKHRHEWPADWADGMTGQQAETIQLVRGMGMAPGRDLADNMLAAVHAITGGQAGHLPQVARLVVTAWREGLAAQLRCKFKLPD
jgi:hypothetical protein